MLYAIIVFLLICCIYVYDIHNYNKSKLLIFYIFIGLLIFLNIFSYKIGGDTDDYMYYWREIYRPISSVDLLDEFDYRSNERPGWIMLSSFLKSVCDDFIILRVPLALFVNLVVAYFIRQNTKFIFSVLLMYFVAFYFNYNFEILRESISVSFFLLSYPYYNNKLWLRYFVCFLCAFMFHESSLVMLIMPLFGLLYNMGNKMIFVSLLSFYLVLMSIDLVDILTYVVPDSFSFYMKFMSYMESETYGVSKVSNRLLSFLSSFCIPIVAFFILKSDPKSRKLSLVVLISIIFNSLTSSVNIFYRFSNYILLPLSIAYVEAIYLVAKKIVLKNSRLFLYIPLLSAYLVYKVYSVYFSGKPDYMGIRFDERYYPYTFIFDKGKSKW